MASRRHERRKKCGSKIRFDSQTSAVAALIRFKKKTGQLNVGTYRCRFCKQWHFGHHAFNS